MGEKKKLPAKRKNPMFPVASKACWGLTQLLCCYAPSTLYPPSQALVTPYSAVLFCISKLSLAGADLGTHSIPLAPATPDCPHWAPCLSDQGSDLACGPGFANPWTMGFSFVIFHTHHSTSHITATHQSALNKLLGITGWWHKTPLPLPYSSTHRMSSGKMLTFHRCQVQPRPPQPTPNLPPIFMPSSSRSCPLS